MNLAEARRPALIEKSGVRLGVLSYNCVGPRESWAGSNRAGTRLARPALIYDLWNHFAARDLRLPRGVAYIALGDGQLPLWEDDLAVPSLEARTVAAW